MTCPIALDSPDFADRAMTVRVPVHVEAHYRVTEPTGVSAGALGGLPSGVVTYAWSGVVAAATSLRPGPEDWRLAAGYAEMASQLRTPEGEAEDAIARERVRRDRIRGLRLV